MVIQRDAQTLTLHTNRSPKATDAPDPKRESQQIGKPLNWFQKRLVYISYSPG